MLPFLPILGSLLKNVVATVGGIVSEHVEDKDLAAQLNLKLTESIMSFDLSKYVAQIEAQRDVLVSEIKGESWMQRNWRPITMLSFVLIVVNNYIIFPYLSLFASTSEFTTKLELPGFMWDCIKLGLSGYIVGRSMEKIADGNGLAGIKSRLINGGN